MADEFTVDVRQLRSHTANLDAIRAQLGTVKSAGAAISQDDAAYGMLCGWIAAILEKRHVRQHDLLTYVEENLSLAADALIRTGNDYEQTDEAAAERVRRVGGL